MKATVTDIKGERRAVLKRAFEAELHGQISGRRPTAPGKLLWLSVEYVCSFSGETDSLSLRDAADVLSAAELGVSSAALMTPEEILSVFPTDKVYYRPSDGMRDYFSAQEELAAFPAQRVLGSQRTADELLDAAYSRRLILFTVVRISLISRVMRLRGEPGVLERFFGEELRTPEKLIPAVPEKKKSRFSVTDGGGEEDGV